MLSAFFYGYGCTNLLGGLLCRRLGGHPVLAAAVAGWSVATFFLPMAASTSLRVLWWARMLCGLLQGSTFAAIYRANPSVATLCLAAGSSRCASALATELECTTNP